MDENNAKIKIPLDTGIEGARNEDAFYITNTAVGEIKNIIKTQNVPDDYYLRIATQSGGCSGVQYVLGFDNHTPEVEKDKSYLIEDTAIVIDRKSLFLLEGITIDFIEQENARGFVFDNPYHQGCGGCGGH